MKNIPCRNCGHLLYPGEDGYEHFGRFYKPFGVPYSSVRCYAPDCNCIHPEVPREEPKNETEVKN